MTYKILFTKQAKKDVSNLSKKSKEKLKRVLLNVISPNPKVGKKLMGKLKGNYSYRLDIKNRIVYSINEKREIVYIKRAKTHYGD